MFVKPAGNAYPVGWGGRRGVSERLGALSKGSARRTVGKAGRPSRTHTLKTIPTFSSREPVCVCAPVSLSLCLQEEVIKEKARLGPAMFTLRFCFPYKSQSHNISFSRDSCATQRLGNCKTVLLFGTIKHLFRELFPTQIFIGPSNTE